MGCQQSIPATTMTSTEVDAPTRTAPGTTTTTSKTPPPPTTTTPTTPTSAVVAPAVTTTNHHHPNTTPITTTAPSPAVSTAIATDSTITPNVPMSPSPLQPPPSAAQPQAPQSQQRQPARNIFAKPLIQTVVTAATNTAHTAHQHVQHVTQAVGTMIMTTTNTTTTHQQQQQQLPYYEKTSDVLTFLQETLATNFVFEQCTTSELQQLSYSMEPYPVSRGTTIIQQGEPIGDYLYIIYQGTVTFVVDNVVVGTATAGQQFGELSLLYSAPRAATVIATSSSSSSSSSSSQIGRAHV